jgi:hypothetical protein
MVDVGVLRGLRVLGLCTALAACAGASDDDDGSNGGGGSPRRQRCFALCDRIQATGCANYDHGSCFQSCVDGDDATTRDGQCTAKFDAYLSCATALSDVCTLLYSPDNPALEPACSAEMSEYFECLTDYCTSNPSKDYCS